MADTVTTQFRATWKQTSDFIKRQMQSRGYRAANELRTASQLVLRGQRSGRRYIVPGTGSVKYYKKSKTAKITYKYYTASAPGEPPAVRTGALRMSWQPRTYVANYGDNYEVHSQARSGQKTDNGKYLLSDLLENGTGRMAPRPHQKQIIDKAMPKIIKIYNEPYV